MEHSALEAVVIKDIKHKIRLVNDESEFYKIVIDKYNRVKKNHPSLVPVMTHMGVTGHFGEMLAVEFAIELYNKLKQWKQESFNRILFGRLKKLDSSQKTLL